MKNCCKTGNENPQSKLRIWAGRITWGIVILLVIGIVLLQILDINV